MGLNLWGTWVRITDRGRSGAPTFFQGKKGAKTLFREESRRRHLCKRDWSKFTVYPGQEQTQVTWPNKIYFLILYKTAFWKLELWFSKCFSRKSLRPAHFFKKSHRPLFSIKKVFAPCRWSRPGYPIKFWQGLFSEKFLPKPSLCIL